MAKYFGRIGFAESVETRPGVWKEVITTEKNYYGDIIRNNRRLENSTTSTNSNIEISNDISIVADSYANQNIYAMRYIEFAGSLWEISSAEIEYPRIRLTIGGVYNGEEASTS